MKDKSSKRIEIDIIAVGSRLLIRFLFNNWREMWTFGTSRHNLIASKSFPISSFTLFVNNATNVGCHETSRLHDNYGSFFRSCMYLLWLNVQAQVSSITSLLQSVWVSTRTALEDNKQFCLFLHDSISCNQAMILHRSLKFVVIERSRESLWTYLTFLRSMT